MAKEDELELDIKTPKSSGKGKLIMIVAVIMLLTTGTAIGVLYFMGMLGGSESAKPVDKADSKKEVVVKPAFYLSLAPPFVVNFEDQTHASYLQVEMQVMARNEHVLNVVRANMPVIRNNILLMLSAQKYERVSTRAGKEQLQKSILEAIRKVVAESSAPKHGVHKDTGKDATAHADNVEQVYFTSFIMQ